MTAMVRAAPIRWIVSAAVLGLLSGCHTFPISRLPDPGERAATVTVVRDRNFAGGGVTYYVSVDGAEIAGLGNDEYTTIRVPEGTHVIAVQWKPMLIFGPWVKTVQIEAQAGGQYLVVATGKIPTYNDLHDGVAVQVWPWDERRLQGKTFMSPGGGSTAR